MKTSTAILALSLYAGASVSSAAEIIKMPRGALHRSDYFMMLALSDVQKEGASVMVNRDLFSAESNSLFGNKLSGDQICFDSQDRIVSFHPSLVNRVNLVTGGETGFLPSQQKTDEYISKFPYQLQYVLKASGYMNVYSNPTGIFYQIKASWFIDNKLARLCTKQDVEDAKLEYLDKYQPNQFDLNYVSQEERWRRMFDHPYTHSPLRERK